MNKDDIKNYAILGKKLADFMTNDVIAKDIKNIVLSPDMDMNRDYYCGYMKCLDDLNHIFRAEMPKKKDNIEFNAFIDRVFKNI